MLLSELQAKIESSYYKHFPNSRVFVDYSSNIYSSIWIRCFLAGEKSENSNNYWDNDILKVSFRIQGENGQELPKLTEDSELPSLSIENHGKSYHIKPESDYLVYSRRTLNFRKSKGDAEKIVNSLDKFFSGLKAQILEDSEGDKIHKNHAELVRIKLGL